MRTHDDHRNTVTAHDFFEHVEAAHAGHFKVERDDLRLEIFDFFQAEIPVHCGSDYLDGVVRLQNLRDEFAHESRIIDHQHPYGRSHC